MTKFISKEFNFDGLYLTYGSDRRFVARFKYGNGGVTSFKKFLKENFTVEEYFNKLENDDIPPLKILEEKGYMSTNMKRALKQMGLPQTWDGFNQYLETVSN